MISRFPSALSHRHARKASKALGLVSGILCLLPACLSANPTGGSVAAGAAHIAGQGTSAVTVNQSSNLAIINWQSFSINAGESTSFLQPGANSAALNRVLGGQTSMINGTLSANGQVYLINGNGIIVGPGGVINASAFTASTRDITDADFLSGNLHFTGSSSAGVQNLGTIQALGGNVVLIGRTVDNEGTITAPKGTAGLIAGDDVLLAQKNADGSTITVSPKTTATSASGQVGVKNSGAIAAAAAELKAANGNIYALAVQNEGTIRATTVTHQGGHIWLTSDAGTVRNSGTLDASATAAGGQGGTITLKSTTGMASHTGQIIARGGVGGAGGNAEISGAQVQFSGTVDLTAPGGTLGNLLIDPATVDIITGGGTDVTASTIDPSAVVAALNGANLTLTGTTSITVDNLVDASANPSAGNLILDTPLLTLNAGIILNGALSGTASMVNVGAGGLVQNGIDAAADFGTVNLTGGATYALAGELIFNKDLDLEGNGAVLNGQGSTRIMEIDSGTVTLNELTMTGGNGASTAGAAGTNFNNSGGALLVFSQTGSATVMITNCTFTGNSASVGGGAILSVVSSGGNNTVSIGNSTFTGNSSPVGSVLYNDVGFGGNANMKLTEDTIVANSGFGTPCGAIYNTVLSSGTALVQIDSSILSGNLDGGGNESDYVSNGGTLTDDGHNLYGQNGNGGGFIPGSAGATDILLGGSIATVLTPLGNYGGPTPTMALVAGSPAIDAGDPAFIGTPDQRGISRGALTAFTDSLPDMGAFEVQFVAVQADPISVMYGQTPNFTYTVTSGPAAVVTGAPALFTGATNVGMYPGDIQIGTLMSIPGFILNFTPGDFTITPQTVLVDPNPGQSKVYGTMDPVLGYVTTGLISGDTLTGALSYTGAGQFANVGTYAINLGNLANSNYTIAFGNGAPTFAITPATLSYVAAPAIVPVGAPFPVFTGTVVGFVGSDTLATATTGMATFLASAELGAPAGYYAINGSGLAATNYMFVQAMGNMTALLIGSPPPPPPPPAPPSTPAAPAPGQPNMPVSQAIAQVTAPPPGAQLISAPPGTKPIGSVPASTPPPLPPGAPLTMNININSISPNEFIDGTPGPAGPADSSTSGNASPGAVAQGSSFSPGIGDKSKVVAVGHTVTLAGGGSAGAPPPPFVQAQLTQILGAGSLDTLSSALSSVSMAVDQGAPAPVGPSAPSAPAQPSAPSSGGFANPNGPKATGPVTVIAPGQTIVLGHGAAANVPPPQVVQMQINQGFSPESRATLAGAASLAGASTTPGGPKPAGAVTMVAPGQTVVLGHGAAANIPPPQVVQMQINQGFSPQSRATLSQAAGL